MSKSFRYEDGAFERKARKAKRNAREQRRDRQDKHWRHVDFDRGQSDNDYLEYARY